MSVKIIGTGSALPEKIVTNDDLTQLVDTSDEWIKERTGIGSRRISTGETVVSLAAQACEKALENAGREAAQVQLLLVATCTPEMGIPCAACQVQSLLGAANAVAFDLNAACAGFLFALNTAYAYIEAGIYENALIVGSEVLSKIVDWTDRGTCVLFGDGAGAVLVERSEQPGILGFVQHSDGTKGEVLKCDSRQLKNPYISLTFDSPFVKMDGREVFAFAVRQVPSCIQEVLQQTQLDAGDVDLYVLHQANRRIVEGIAKRLGVEMDKFPMNLDRVGNMSSAAIPVLLDELNREGRLQEGMTLVLSGFGAGLTYGACVLRW
ncbi:MAG: ketoacyl-ACP synthase III [Lachnospiraceae bacterium]|nr:ketoacyl-ACP synthase III [Lachnospiraceae bacterium]